MTRHVKNNQMTENVKDVVLVASIYNGWKEMSRSIIECKEDNKPKYNINRGNKY